MTTAEDGPSPDFVSARSSLTVGTGSQLGDVAELVGGEHSGHKSSGEDPSATAESSGEEQMLDTMKVSQTAPVTHLDQPPLDTPQPLPASSIHEVAQDTRVADTKMAEHHKDTDTTKNLVPPTPPPTGQSPGTSSHLTPGSASPEPPLTPTALARNERRESRRLSSLDVCPYSLSRLTHLSRTNSLSRRVTTGFRDLYLILYIGVQIVRVSRH